MDRGTKVTRLAAANGLCAVCSLPAAIGLVGEPLEGGPVLRVAYSCSVHAGDVWAAWSADDCSVAVFGVREAVDLVLGDKDHDFFQTGKWVVEVSQGPGTVTA